MSSTILHRGLLPLSIAFVISAPGGAAAASRAAIDDASVAEPATTYPHLGRFAFPAANGLDKRVYDWGCRGGRIPDLVLRWDCAGARNTYLLGHAASVFNPVADAYRSGRLKPGKAATWTRDGVARTYRVTWIRIVDQDYVWKGRTGDQWAWNATSRPSITLQTCWGAGGDRRLIVRLVLDP
jgi:hypothetical protein